MPGDSAIDTLALAGDLRIDLCFLTEEIARTLRTAFDKEMDAIGLTRAQWRALVYVLRLNGPTQSELAEALELGRASVGALVDQLEKSGYVRRKADRADRRVWRVAPTDLALRRANAISDSARKVASAAFYSIADCEVSDALRTLRAIRDNLKD